MSYRIELLNSIIKEDIAHRISQIKPDNEHIINVVYVKLNEDGSRAEIGISITPEDSKNMNIIIKLLNNNKSKIQGDIARHHRLRKAPILNFFNDTQNDLLTKIDQLIDQTRNERH